MADSLELILIPTASQWLVFPKELVSNIYPYAPSLSIEEGSPFVIGSLLVENEIIPFVDLDFNHQRTQFDTTQGFRIVMVATISMHAKYSHYAVLSYEEPLQLTGDNSIFKNVVDGTHTYIAKQATIKDERLENKSCIIPNLPLFESELSMR